MKKSPGKKSLLQKFGFGVKVVVALEAASLIGSYFIWRKMNHDREFRYSIYQISPYALNYFYKIGETLGGTSTRQEDYAAWGVKQIES